MDGGARHHSLAGNEGDEHLEETMEETDWNDNSMGQRHDRNDRIVSYRSSHHSGQHGVLDSSSRMDVLDIKADVAVFSGMVVLAVESRGVRV